MTTLEALSTDFEKSHFALSLQLGIWVLLGAALQLSQGEEEKGKGIAVYSEIEGMTIDASSVGASIL